MNEFPVSKIYYENAAQLRKSIQTRSTAGQASKKRWKGIVQRKKAAQRRKVKKLNTARLILIAVLILVLAGGAFFALQFPQGGF